jgi:hypothetical protein
MLPRENDLRSERRITVVPAYRAVPSLRERPAPLVRFIARRTPFIPGIRVESGNPTNGHPRPPMFQSVLPPAPDGSFPLHTLAAGTIFVVLCPNGGIVWSTASRGVDAPPEATAKIRVRKRIDSILFRTWFLGFGFPITGQAQAPCFGRFDIPEFLRQAVRYV